MALLQVPDKALGFPAGHQRRLPVRAQGDSWLYCGMPEDNDAWAGGHI